jgi:hypothetical protein
MSNPTPKPNWDLNTFTWVNEARLPGFGRLLESWLNVHRKYCVGLSLQAEHAWEYSERPQVGLLSNAAAIIGGITLEEWNTEKFVDEEKKRYGRNDLWLRLNPPTKSQDYQLEAKHRRIDLRGPVDASGLLSVMNEAQSAAKVLNPKHGKIVAASFLTLRFASEDTDELDEKIQELFIHIQDRNRIKKDLDAIAGVWIGVEDFLSSRIQRKQIDKNWTNDEVGVIFLASLNK